MEAMGYDLAIEIQIQYIPMREDVSCNLFWRFWGGPQGFVLDMFTCHVGIAAISPYEHVCISTIVQQYRTVLVIQYR